MQHPHPEDPGQGGDGGGVYLTGYYAVFTMNNGQITGCKAPSGNGGGVCLAGSDGLTPKMKGKTQ